MLHFIKRSLNARVGLVALIAFCMEFLPGSTNAQELIHRYSFDSDASDLVGTAHGGLGGNATIVNGAVALDGVDALVDLPNDLVAELTNVTFEIWATWNGGPPYQSLISFGSNQNGEDIQGAAIKNLYLTPNNGSGLALTIFTNSAAQSTILAAALRPGVVHQIVWTHDGTSSVSKLYVDGRPAATNNVTLALKDLGVTDNNWLGRSQYPQDQDFDGSIAEFRIYDGVLGDEAIADHYSRGPDPSGKGDVLSLEFRSSSKLRPGGSHQLVVVANYEKLFGLDVSSGAEVAYEVSDPSVLSVTLEGVVASVGHVAASAEVTARLGGRSVSQTISVIPSEEPRLLHRYAFDSDANDLVGSAHGELVGNAVIERGAVHLDGIDAYVNLPNGLVQGLTNATFEVWAVWHGGNSVNWQRIMDFGNSSFGEDGEGFGYGVQSILLTPYNGSNLEVSIFTDEIQNEQTVGAAPLEQGTLHQIVWAYDALVQTARLYVDGIEVGVTTGMTHTLSDLGPTVNNWLGRSQYSWDPYYKGSIAEFRIYEGALGTEQVAENYRLGPDPAGRGAVQSLDVANFHGFMRLGDSQQLRVFANYERVEGINVTFDPSLIFEVSNAELLSVDAKGWLEVIGTEPGSATVTISYLEASEDIVVQALPQPESALLHRYSFDTNSDDSIGGAHGELKGNAVIQDGELVLDGVDSFLNLPNNLIGGLTNATFEVWTRWNGGSIWQRIIDFGNSSFGEDGEEWGYGIQSIFLTPNNGSSLEVSIFTDEIQNEQTVNADILTAGVMHHIVWTYDAVTLKGRLFLDGVPVGENLNMTHTLAELGETSNNWLGRSQYSWDSYYHGAIQELRIYDGPLLPEKVAVNYHLGPDRIESSAPVLSLSNTNGGLELVWETSEIGLVLESTERLESGEWQDETGEIDVIGNLNRARIPTEANQRFYRLRR